MGDRERPKPIAQLVRILGGGAGVVLLVIGVRFLIWPEGAVRTFGLGRAPSGTMLASIIGLRDLWLAGLAITFAALREWRALALWLLFGTAVCFGDAALVAALGGGRLAVLFHVASGIFCAVVGWRCWSIAHRNKSKAPGRKTIP